MKASTAYRISALGVLSIVGFLFFNLEWFPGLHGDEAWVGLYAGRVKLNGLYTPHLMNDYTGAMFGWAVHRLFEAFGVSVRALRSLGAALNAAAAAGFVFWAGRRFGARSALAMTALLASSGLFLVYGRVAWEVCAFEHFLVLAVLCSCRPFVEENRFPLVNLFVFFSAIEFGILNHFIFLSVPLSLAVYAAAAGTLLKDRRAARLRPLFFLSLLLGALCYGKRFLTPELFVAHRAAWLTLFFGLPFVFTASFRGLAPRLARFHFPDGRWARRGMLFVTGAGALAFCIWHLTPMIQIYSGVALMRRVSSLDPAGPVRWALYAWGAALMGLLLRRIIGTLRTPAVASEGAYARFVLLWTGAYLSVFILMRHTSSIRYYLIMHALTLAALAVVAAGGRLWSRPRIAALGGVVVLGLHGFYWREAFATPQRPPLQFRIGFRKEKSIDFIDKRGLFARMDRDGICAWDQSKQDFLYIPAIFHRAARPVACDPAKSAQLEYCRECGAPPFYSYSLK